MKEFRHNIRYSNPEYLMACILNLQDGESLLVFGGYDNSGIEFTREKNTIIHGETYLRRVKGEDVLHLEHSDNDISRLCDVINEYKTHT